MVETKITLSVQTISKKVIEAVLKSRVIQLEAVTGIDSDEMRGFAYETVTKARKDIKNVETERKKITKVFDDEKKKYMELEKEMIEGISFESERVTKLMAEYDREQIKKANEEQERFNRQVQEQREKQEQEQTELSDIFGSEAKLNVGTSFIEAVINRQTELPKGTTTVKQFRVLDLEKVPSMFKVLDEVKVRQAMKDGIEIAGIEYYTEQKTTFR